MRAEDTVQYIFDFFPEYSSRKRVLYMLFCMSGNGFYWRNGELILNDDRMNRYNLKKPVKHAHPCILSTQLRNDFLHEIELMKIRYRKQGKSIEEIKNIIDKKINDKLPYDASLLKYSDIYNYPDNIKPDWLKLIQETKQYLREDGYDIY